MMSETMVSDVSMAGAASSRGVRGPRTYAYVHASRHTGEEIVVRRSAARMRTSRRKRIGVALLCAVLTWFVVGVMMPLRADSAPRAMEVVSYTVRPGDTLWSYAQSITPQGGDVSQRVDELMRLNDLESTALQVGQRIVVPVDD